MEAGGETDIKFPPWFFPDFWLRLTFELKTRALVTVTANIKYEPHLPAKRFRARDAGGVMQKLDVQRQGLVQAREQTNDGNRHKEIDNLIKPILDKLEQLTRLHKLYTKMKTTPGKIHFRVYTVIDEQHRVTVMQSFTPKESRKDTESGDGTEVPSE